MPIIEVKNLTKVFKTFKRREGIGGSIKDLLHRTYTDFVAVDSISLKVEEGELLGYIGPNGAGKSTSIKMLTGILAPTSGEVSVLGYQPFRDRKVYTNHIGVVFGQRTQLWWDIAALESFRLLAKIYRVPPAQFKKTLDELCSILEIGDILHTPVRKLSLGQRMRCDLAASLIHRPRMLFLDEPTIGLDAVAKDSVRTFLRRINRDYGTTILLTTHDLNEIEELCNRIVILDKGRFIYDGGIESIKNLPGLNRQITLDFPGTVPLDELKTRFHGDVEFEVQGERRLIGNFDPKKISTVEVMRRVLERHEVSDLGLAEPSIEDVVMKIYRSGINPDTPGAQPQAGPAGSGRA